MLHKCMNRAGWDRGIPETDSAYEPFVECCINVQPKGMHLGLCKLCTSLPEIVISAAGMG